MILLTNSVELDVFFPVDFPWATATDFDSDKDVLVPSVFELDVEIKN